MMSPLSLTRHAGLLGFRAEALHMIQFWLIGLIWVLRGVIWMVGCTLLDAMVASVILFAVD